MTEISGSQAPLHKRFNQADSLRQIRNRYRTFRDVLGGQVEALQKCPAFLVLARGYYAAGFKDWHILSAVYNLRLNWETLRLGLDPWDSMKNAETRKLVQQIVEHSVEEPNRIAERHLDLDRMFCIFDATWLQTYGFEPRRPDFHPDVVRRFLKERMRHYDMDLEHDALFGDPPGSWPKDLGE